MEEEFGHSAVEFDFWATSYDRMMTAGTRGDFSARDERTSPIEFASICDGLNSNTVALRDTIKSRTCAFRARWNFYRGSNRGSVIFGHAAPYFGLADRPETFPKLLGKNLRLLPSREVATL
jgi:hypothetical protein